MSCLQLDFKVGNTESNRTYYRINISIFFSDGQDSDAIQPEAEITVLTVEGGRADLPCDITAKNKDDSVYLVLWYRKTGTPIYR